MSNEREQLSRAFDQSRSRLAYLNLSLTGILVIAAVVRTWLIALDLLTLTGTAPSSTPMKACLRSSGKMIRMLQKTLLSKQANIRSTIEGR